MSNTVTSSEGAPTAGDGSNGGSESKTIRIGTRKSPLAMAQAELVVRDLQALFPTHGFHIHGTTTTGDRDQQTALYNFGGKGLWTTQLEEQLTRGDVDLVVHSLKDMPTELPAGCAIGCITRREDPRDTLVVKPALADRHGWKTLDDLPDGSVIGTSSIRRIAQLARRHPRLRFKDHRGNIQTRLRKLDDDPELTAIILAAAGLQRMGLGGCISQYLEYQGGGMLHAVGQGALAVECRDGDERILALLGQLAHAPTAMACAAERSLMRTLEGGCSVPIGVETHWEGDDDARLHMRATVVNVDGTQAVDADMTEAIASDEAADEFGKRVALELVRLGAGPILDQINAARPAPGTGTNETAQTATTAPAPATT